MDVESATTIFRYRPLALIGRGGMAEVLLALTNSGAGQLVVLKRIWPELVEDPDFVAMFRDQARLAIRLDHPNVVRTHELIEDAAQLAIAMEYLHGQPLVTILGHHRGPPELNLTLRLHILVDLLAGLDHAHELTGPRGAPLDVVHRDVSPENVFVTYDGQVKLVDFGVAQMAGVVHRTRPGTLRGKLSYIAPECIRGGGVDRRADIFAVGVMLWELVTGRRLWQGMGEAQIVHYLAAGMPMPRLPVNRRRPPWLAEVCARALAIDPGERYGTAAALRNDLQAALPGTADAYAQRLGRVVAEAFAEDRVAREALIARALAGERPGARTIGMAKETVASSPGAGGLYEDAAVEAWVAPEPPPAPPPRRGGQVRVGIAALVSVAVALALMAAQAHHDVRSPLPAAPSSPIPSLPAEPADDPPGAFAAAADPGPVTPEAATAGASHAKRRPGRRARGGRRDHPPGTRVRGTSVDEGRSDAAPGGDLVVGRLPPAAVRTIDESDPFR